MEKVEIVQKLLLEMINLFFLEYGIDESRSHIDVRFADNRVNYFRFESIDSVFLSMSVKDGVNVRNDLFSRVTKFLNELCDKYTVEISTNVDQNKSVFNVCIK